MNEHRNGPDPTGLAIAQDIQQKVHPSEIILSGSRAAGDNRPDSDVDLTAVAPDSETAEQTREVLNGLLQGKRDVPVVNANTITREEFHRWAIQGQSFAGQAARYGVTPKGHSLNYQPERHPTPEEIRELTLFWLRLAHNHLTYITVILKYQRPCHPECLARDTQWGLERSFKGILSATNDPLRFKRNAAFLWQHIKSVQPIEDNQGAEAMENLLSATTRLDGAACGLTDFSEAYRRNTDYPTVSKEELEALVTWAKPAIGALITEGLRRAGANEKELTERSHIYPK